MKGQDEGISFSSDLIAIVVGDLGSHDAVMNGGCHLHDLQSFALRRFLHQKVCIKTAELRCHAQSSL